MKIGSIEVRNRIVFLPTGAGFGQNGRPTEQQIYYLAELAKGGAGLIICATLMADPTAGLQGPFAAYDPDNNPAFKDMAGEVHKHGAKMFVQIAHMGRPNTSFFS